MASTTTAAERLTRECCSPGTMILTMTVLAIQQQHLGVLSSSELVAVAADCDDSNALVYPAAEGSAMVSTMTVMRKVMKICFSFTTPMKMTLAMETRMPGCSPARNLRASLNNRDCDDTYRDQPRRRGEL